MKQLKCFKSLLSQKAMKLNCYLPATLKALARNYSVCLNGQYLKNISFITWTVKRKKTQSDI